MPLETLDQTVRKGKTGHMHLQAILAGLVCNVFKYNPEITTVLNPAVLDVFTNFVKQRIFNVKTAVRTNLY